MEQDKLNIKLGEWAGFRQLPKGNKGFHYEHTEKVMDWMSPNETQLFMSRRNVPNFTDSLDDCFEWLAPKDYQQILFQPDGYCCIIIDDKLYEGSGETLAASFCSAIERLIDGS